VVHRGSDTAARGGGVSRRICGVRLRLRANKRPCDGAARLSLLQHHAYGVDDDPPHRVSDLSPVFGVGLQPNTTGSLLPRADAFQFICRLLTTDADQSLGRSACPKRRITEPPEFAPHKQLVL